MPTAVTDRLLALFAECSSAGEYESAYHLLMAAVHLADHRADSESLAAIEEAAGALERAIEAASPSHPLARAQAEQRGQHSLCESLRVHIEAVRLRLRSAGQRQRWFGSTPA